MALGLHEIALLSIAAFLAGGLNAIAGGGSFLTFPALVWAGVPPIPANATSAVAVFPGYLSSAMGYWHDIRALPRGELARLIAVSVLGGVAGSVLLLITPSDLFRVVVPWLLLFATLLFAFDAQIRRWVRTDTTHPPRGKWAATLAVTTYGGYFNGGLGIVLLALFSGLGYRDMNLMNGLKNVLSFLLSAASVATFALAGVVHWPQAVVMMVAATLGGYVGARAARRMSKRAVRAVVIAVGFAMTVAFWSMG